MENIGLIFVFIASLVLITVFGIMAFFTVKDYLEERKH
jgi:uncharacterized membrane protein YqiK